MTAVVGVFPKRAKEQRARLFGALERSFDARFEARSYDEPLSIDAAVFIESDGSSVEDLSGPALPCPLLVLLGGQSDARRAGEIAVGTDASLDVTLRGRRLRDRNVSGSLTPAADDEILATLEKSPVWLRRTTGQHAVEIATAAPRELGTHESLRDRFTDGDFLGLLPLVGLLRRLVADDGWEPPPLRAAFMFDDPNLHWKSYGYIDFEELAAHARRFGYHAASAMVPLDGWYCDARARRVFLENHGSLSLLIHGNNHLRSELAQETTDAHAVAVAAQALRRATAFERRYGIEVARVMAPPHGRCSEQMLDAMLVSGFEAVSIAGTPPWYANAPLVELRSWEPAGFFGAGLPVLERMHFGEPRADLPLRAFLRQPLILYGHHGDLAQGLDLLEQLAGEVNALGDVEWCSITQIARSGFSARRDGRTLTVRMFARRAVVSIPEGVDEVRVELSATHAFPALETALVGRRAQAFDLAAPQAAVRVAVQGPVDVAIELRSARAGRAVDGQLPVSAWAVARRALAEGRDRLQPLVRRRRSPLARPS